ncbi:MAG: hypothetical protein A2Y33_12510 [Spirochaetes bacterium GWF1_51_8]|nr:MAG: hypothetical protein A2Y33_12510 [Spirochaetes bacterium GWF1_51_8]
MNITKEKENFIATIKTLPDEVFAEVKDFTDFLITRKNMNLEQYSAKIIAEDKNLLKRLAE